MTPAADLRAAVSTAGIVNPKAALVFGPWAKTEFYVDAGTGFHSNDARGATITVDSTGIEQGGCSYVIAG